MRNRRVQLPGDGLQLLHARDVPGVLLDADDPVVLEPLSYLPQVLGLLLEPRWTSRRCFCTLQVNDFFTEFLPSITAP